MTVHLEQLRVVGLSQKVRNSPVLNGVEITSFSFPHSHKIFDITSYLQNQLSLHIADTELQPCARYHVGNTEIKRQGPCAHMYHGIQLSNKRVNTTAGNNLDEPQGNYAQ